MALQCRERAPSTTSNPVLRLFPPHVRLSPASGIPSGTAGCLSRAKRGQSAAQQKYEIKDILTRVNPEGWRALRMLALELDVPLQALCVELLKKHGRRAVVQNPWGPIKPKQFRTLVSAASARLLHFVSRSEIAYRFRETRPHARKPEHVRPFALDRSRSAPESRIPMPWLDTTPIRLHHCARPRPTV